MAAVITMVIFFVEKSRIVEKSDKINEKQKK